MDHGQALGPKPGNQRCDSAFGARIGPRLARIARDRHLSLDINDDQRAGHASATQKIGLADINAV